VKPGVRNQSSRQGACAFIGEADWTYAHATRPQNVTGRELGGYEASRPGLTKRIRRMAYEGHYINRSRQQRLLLDLSRQPRTTARYAILSNNASAYASACHSNSRGIYEQHSLHDRDRGSKLSWPLIYNSSSMEIYWRTWSSLSQVRGCCTVRVSRPCYVC